MTAPIASGEGQESSAHGGPCVTPLADLRKDALQHYDEISNKACDWFSVIPRAINFYFDAEEAKAVAASPVSVPVSAQCRLCGVTMDVGEATTFTICSTCFEKRRAPDPASAEEPLTNPPMTFAELLATYPSATQVSVRAQLAAQQEVMREFLAREGRPAKDMIGGQSLREWETLLFEVERKWLDAESRLASFDRRVGELEQENAAVWEVIDSACIGLREPMTLDDARRVQAMLTHHHVQHMKQRVTKSRAALGTPEETP